MKLNSFYSPLFQSTRVFILSSLMGLTQNSAFADSLSIESPETRVNFLELYTSQGCSSCPPAEHWLSKFENDPRLWKQFIPINFHVDYWDYIGWKDPFADKQFSTRQRWYEHLGLTNNVATPGFVLNGKGWNGWFRGQEPRIDTQKPVGIISAKIDDEQITVQFKPVDQNLNKDPLSVHVAVLGFNVTTNVTSGENKGRELMHDFVVLAHGSQYLAKYDGIAKARLTMPDVSSYQNEKKAVVVWVSTRNDPSPIQAAGDWL